MLAGRMMDFPLTLTHLLDRARTFYGRSEIVSRRPDRSLHRSTYADFYRRACQLAHALKRLGVQPGDRVASLCWNHHQHLELYFAVPAMGAVLHTLNLRLAPKDLGYIAHHAGDRILVVDRTLLPLLEKFVKDVPSIEHVIVIPDDGPAPEGTLDYEQCLASEPTAFDFPTLEERSAAMLCYTSGTTGNPKGVLFSHRSIVLHTLVSCMGEVIGPTAQDVMLPVVPMFHAAAWGLPFDALITGAKLVFPGPHLDAVSLLDLMAQERVTLAGGVPTIWLGILALLDQEPKRWDLRTIRAMLIGGSAAPASLIDGFMKRHGLHVTHAWGMTELNPVGTLARLKPHHADLDDAARLDIRASQGYPIPFVEQRHVSDTGQVLPWDGKTMGELEVRGPWVARSYYSDEGADRFTQDGWFKTGDVVTIDAEGYLRITDRSKDVIKSGGEWISSVALENALMAHPAVLEAAVFAARHPKWDERPLAAVVLKPGQRATAEELAAYLQQHFVKWWLPEDYLFVPQIPRTSTGKFLKMKLREEFGDHLMKTASP
ncbi:long-chain fatty acid--CoA ligase [Stigmatella aurantiaca]|uniref:Medium-chain-fatty-acid--CoA ligase n=1 Tax=Stigmatella aurantiaca (strain DW4/3-1) TaxID=378806 RepID=Q08SD3_STIAD|nr:long-chain fatty acid--CoA ligase [Stigmatella aurantiaca]ADO70706.1 Medium-chain fatty acid--CoA ligase [Stigmatella aurantiaca DW4/3-1]EAU63394.1 medium-chain-fatty-acid--CoA ligase [Stigmatella aurantiaca DW4/3-1]